MPHGMVILVSFLSLGGSAVIAIIVLVPILIAQLGSFISNVPDYVRDADQVLRDLQVARTSLQESKLGGRKLKNPEG